MTHNPFSAMTRRDWMLWLTSLVIVALANVLAGGTDALTLCATLAGVTALIFMALGNAWGPAADGGLQRAVRAGFLAAAVLRGDDHLPGHDPAHGFGGAGLLAPAPL